MGVFPEGAQVVPNPFNKIPGFSVGDVHFVPGFPVMAPRCDPPGIRSISTSQPFAFKTA